MHYDDDFDKPPIVFARAGPEDEVPFVFNRTDGIEYRDFF